MRPYEYIKIRHLEPAKMPEGWTASVQIDFDNYSNEFLVTNNCGAMIAVTAATKQEVDELLSTNPDELWNHCFFIDDGSSRVIDTHKVTKTLAVFPKGTVGASETSTVEFQEYSYRI